MKNVVDYFISLVKIDSESRNEKKIAEKLREKRLMARTITIKVRYENFESVTRTKTLPHKIDTADEIMQLIPELLAQTEAGHRKVRLLGVSTSNLVSKEMLSVETMQLYLPFKEFQLP